MLKRYADLGLKQMLEKLGVNAQDCIYVDNRSGNLNAARKVGMNPVLLNSRNESYDGVVVNSFEELEKEIDKFQF